MKITDLLKPEGIKVGATAASQMDAIDRQEADGKIFVIRPPQALGIQRTEIRPEELERVYQTGRREAPASAEGRRLL